MATLSQLTVIVIKWEKRVATWLLYFLRGWLYPPIKALLWPFFPLKLSIKKINEFIDFRLYAKSFQIYRYQQPREHNNLPPFHFLVKWWLLPWNCQVKVKDILSLWSLHRSLLFLIFSEVKVYYHLQSIKNIAWIFDLLLAYNTYKSQLTQSTRCFCLKNNC